MNYCIDCLYFKEDNEYGYSMGRCLRNVSTSYKVGYVFTDFCCGWFVGVVKKGGIGN